MGVANDILSLDELKNRVGVVGDFDSELTLARDTAINWVTAIANRPLLDTTKRFRRCPTLRNPVSFRLRDWAGIGKTAMDAKTDDIEIKYFSNKENLVPSETYASGNIVFDFYDDILTIQPALTKSWPVSQKDFWFTFNVGVNASLDANKHLLDAVYLHARSSFVGADMEKVEDRIKGLIFSISPPRFC